MKKGIIYSFIISLVICMIMPFYVSASTTGSQISFTNTSGYTGNIRAYQVAIQPVSNYSGSTYTHAYYIQFDAGLYGYVQGNFGGNTSDLWGVAVVDGISELFYSNQTNLTINYVSVSNDSSVIPQSLLDDISSIEDKLQLISKVKDYNFPIESFSYVSYLFAKNYEVQYNWSFSYYTYPVFKIPQGSYIAQPYLNNGQYLRLIFGGINAANATQLQNYISTSLTISSVKVIQSNNYNNRILQVDFLNDGMAQNTYFITAIQDLYIMPIFMSRNFDPNMYNVSTDFALLFGLSNQLLDDLHIIAQGTNQSQSAAGDLEEGTSDLASDISSYNQIESDYNNQMNQALNNIDFSDQFSNNQNFLSGASFVKTVFNSFMQIDILRIFFIVLCIVLIAKRFI